MLLFDHLPSNYLCPLNMEHGDAYEVYIHGMKKSEN